MEIHLRRWIERNYGSRNILIKIAEFENLGQERITKKLELIEEGI